MSADAIVRDVLTTVPKAVAAGVVDLASGLMLSIRTVQSLPRNVLEILAPTTRELFEGEMVTSIENQLKAARGVTSDERYFQEMLIASSHLWHYFARLKKHPRIVLCVVTTLDVNFGMFLVRCREYTDQATV